MKEYRPYKITVRLSGNIQEFDTDNGIITFNPIGNKRTSEASALKSVKDTVRLAGCKVEEVISMEKVM